MKFSALLAVYETNDAGFVFEGSNMEDIVLPLQLIGSNLTKGLLVLVGEKAVKLSQAEAKWHHQVFLERQRHGHRSAYEVLGLQRGSLQFVPPFNESSYRPPKRH